MTVKTGSEFDSIDRQTQETTDFGAKLSQALNSAEQASPKQTNQQFTAGTQFGANQQPNQTQYQAAPQFQAQQQQAFNPYSPKRKGLLANQARLVPYNPTGAKVAAFMSALEEVAKTTTRLETDTQWEFLPFDGPSNRAEVSAILMVRRQGNAVAVFSLLVQDSMEPLSDKQFTNRNTGITIAVPQLTEELITSSSYTAERMCEFVQSQQKYAQCKVFLLGALVLPPELEPTNLENLRRIVFYASDALESTTIRLGGDDYHFNIGQKERDEVLSIKFDYNAGQVTTAVGFPVRSDLSIKMFVTKEVNNNVALGANTRAQFSTANVYPELIYLGDQGYNLMQTNQYGQVVVPPQFQASVIVSSLANQFEGASLETQLLALSTVMGLTVNGNWMSLVQPNLAITTQGDDPKDIGMITADVNPGGESVYTPVKTENYPWQQYINRLVDTRSVVVRMDVAEMGDLTTIQRVFLDVAGVTRDENVAQRAYEQIVEAANHLTSGAFNNHWRGNEPIVFNDVGRIEKGYYISNNGELRSLEEIDYLYCLNKLGVEAAREYMDSMNPGTGDQIVRFSKRRRIYDTYFNYKITGFAYRLTFNPAFLLALSNAVRDAGGVAKTETTYHEGQSVERGYAGQLLGVPVNQTQQFMAGSVYGGGYGPQMGNGYNTWRTFQPGYQFFG